MKARRHQGKAVLPAKEHRQKARPQQKAHHPQKARPPQKGRLHPRKARRHQRKARRHLLRARQQRRPQKERHPRKEPLPLPPQKVLHRLHLLKVHQPRRLLPRPLKHLCQRQNRLRRHRLKLPPKRGEDHHKKTDYHQSL
ncbi:serine/arginine repetitive matrix protein 1 isoform X4 [Pectinophora gossypiella]|uniref:serine/arginine repetitive matrix protein 1 isoform X2 n=1 Tax=Pectinophora gossypiella TaxID=13191 RepID=UPI00214DF9FE|nr:serine/arginine repetitive matrix protein 1 isoform X2 [Pectinophora gossypiella]XP_049888252.1 serine/arginine repetitive matrix protein 1 isoform X3 [Pectinophora gossypiella]XP_049888253.1 serine/arginine repetitive matrix protein 1 isoform X4 [Pectinophora gossypiella]